MNRLRRALFGTKYVVNRNRRRLVFLLAALTLAIVAWGAKGLVENIFSLVGFLPLLAIQIAFAAVYIVFYFGLIMWFLSRPRKYQVTPDSPQIGLSFENYRGQPDLLEHARSTVAILRGEREFEARGGEMPKGMLLSGKPGTGKTFLAGCIAAEAGLPFIYVDASSLRGMFWGMDSMMIMKLFRDARGLGRQYAQPGSRGACILFMDELDSIGMARQGSSGGLGMGMGGMMGGGSYGLNTLLNQMDSLGDLVEDRWSRRILRWFGVIWGPVKPKPLVFVIGATNRPEVLDSALTRPGRLDRMLEVHVPDADGRRDIIAHYLSNKAHDPDIPMDLLVTDSMGWSPVMIKTIINEALVIAYEDGRESLTLKDWLNAADMRTLGLKQPIRSWNLQDRKETAYHEAGHAVAARYLRPEARISKATIIRRGHALGYVQQRPKEERTSLYARSIETGIMVALAGHVVENRFIGKLSTGPSSDLWAATNAAIDYVGELGMGPTKLIVLTIPPSPPVGPVMVAAHELLDQLYEETERLLREKQASIHALAAALLEHDELIGEELEAVFRTAEEQHPELRQPFERRIIRFRAFLPPPKEEKSEEWSGPQVVDTAARDPNAARDPGGPGDDRDPSGLGDPTGDRDPGDPNGPPIWAWPELNEPTKPPFDWTPPADPPTTWAGG